MKVLITGATGLIGQEIIKLCHNANYDVHYLTTNKTKLKSERNYTGFLWDPVSGFIDTNCFNGVEVIIHLAGATVAKRWTNAYKKEIIDSRVLTTKLLIESLEKITHSVRQVVSASAIGVYKDSFKNYYMEEDNKDMDTSFLADVVNKWETEVLTFKKIGVEVCLLRIGVVLSENGGVFLKITKPIQLGIGAVFGNGKQWQSWIHILDLARLFIFVVEEELEGIYNAVAPNAVSNHKLTHCIARKLDKKIRLPNVPKFVMKMILGEMHILLFSSQRVCSTKIIQNGFHFHYENISQAVDDLLNKFDQ